jgi:hypothetical protein
MNPINYLPILVASLVSFAISSLWYSPMLFGKEWLALRKISETEIADIQARGVWKSYLAQFIMTLITFSVLAFVVSMAETRSSSDDAFLGLLAWLGFIVPISLSSWLWKKESFTLVMIDAVNNLIVLTIGGAIIGAWK